MSATTSTTTTEARMPRPIGPGAARRLEVARRREAVHAAALALAAETGRPPSASEVANRVGVISTSTAYSDLSALRAAGRFVATRRGHGDRGERCLTPGRGRGRTPDAYGKGRLRKGSRQRACPDIPPGYARRAMARGNRNRWTAEDAAIRDHWKNGLSPGVWELLTETSTLLPPGDRAIGGEPPGGAGGGRVPEIAGPIPAAWRARRREARREG